MAINKDFLIELLSTHSPSGYEKEAIDVFLKYVKPFAKHEFSDKVGNAAFSVGKGNIKLMLSAHVDEIALQVQNIDDKGFIHFISDGDVDKKVLLGSTVIIHTANGPIHGVIGKAPIYIEYHSDNKDKAIEIKDMKIDIGTESKEETLKLVSIGDPITVDCNFIELGENRFSCHGLDDKVGLFVVGEVMRHLSTAKLKNLKVYGVACTQEETSASGAVGAAVKIDPNYSIDYDVTFATDDDYVSPNEWGDIKLGKGGAIAHGADSNKSMVDLVKGICQNMKLPYQEFSLGSGGTDTVWIKQSSTNAETLLLSIPNRNMHTQVEVCDYRDLQSLIDMTVMAVLEIDKRHS